MADQSSPAVRIQDFGTLNEFFGELERRGHVRLVKVADQGLVEPARRGTGLVMQPMVRVVATAFDYKTNEILRWSDKWDVGSGAVAINGRHNDPTGERTRERIILECQMRSLQVVRDQEWTKEDVEGTLAEIGVRGS